MAIDVYLQIEGIKGESADDKHQGWIECDSVCWAISQPRSATASTGGGHTAERAELSDISFTKLADLTSPILAQTCAAGKTIPKTGQPGTQGVGLRSRQDDPESEIRIHAR